MKTNSIAPLNSVMTPMAETLLISSIAGRFRRLLLTLLALGAVCLGANQASAVGNVVIYEVYGAGGNVGATLYADYVVLFNRSGSSVSLNGWSVQYLTAAGSGTWAVAALPNVTLLPGQYFCYRQASGANGAAFTADATNTLAMAATAGKVALVNNTTALSGQFATGTGPTIVDFVGYGATANGYEGSGATPAPSTTLAVRRAGGGCTDTDNNSSDFATVVLSGGSPPLTIATTPAPCGGPNPPNITEQPQSRVDFAGVTATFSVTATGDAPLSYQWYKDNFATPLSDGGQIGGATTNTLGITNVTGANDGGYFVVVTNSAGSATSSPLATLTVTNPVPILLSQPSSRTIVRGATASLEVSAYAAPPITYQWQRSDTNIADGVDFSGTTTATLTLPSFNDNSVGDYTVIVTNAAGAVTSSPPATLSIVDSGTLVGWNFNVTLNTSSPVPSHGISGTASLVGGITGFSNNVASGLSGLDNSTTFPNAAWGTATYLTNGNVANNKTAGVQFNVSTVGVRNPNVAFDHRASATGSRYSRLQYTTNGVDYYDYPISADINPNNLTANLTYQSKSYSLVGFPNVANNPDFGIRIVTEFESTAKYGATNNNNYVGNTGAYNTGGTLSYDIVNITAEAITNASLSPVISSTTNLTVLDVAGSSNIFFTISDADTSAGTLTLSAVSGNTTVLPSPSVINNNDGTATLTITPTPNQLGIAPIIVTVMDEYGNAATTWFYVTVVPSHFAPMITQLPHTNTLYNTPLTMAFTVGDDVTAAGGLSVSGVSANQTVVPDANITFGGSASNRTVTLTPVTGQMGTARITVSVNDNDSQNPKTTTTTFTVMVRPSTNVVLNDFFDYPDGAITAQSGGLYQNHSGTFNQLQVAGGKAIVNGSANTEDVNALLIGNPYTTNGGTVLYYSYYLNCTTLPSEGGAYISHFKDLNTGASTGFGGRIWVSTTNAASGMFRVGTGNGEGTTNTTAQFPMDLAVNTPYLVVVKFNPLTGTNTTLWVNPFNESSPNVVATNVSGVATQPNPIDVYGFAFRESTGGGVVAVDNLMVGKSFADVVPVLNINKPGTDTVVSWSNPLWGLLAAPTVTGAYTNVPGATTPYTNLPTAGETYYRLTNINNLGPL